jgi:hypothetical protein
VFSRLARHGRSVCLERRECAFSYALQSCVVSALCNIDGDPKALESSIGRECRGSIDAFE